MEERLQKLLSAAGLCSRRQAEEYLRAGRVAVNGAAAGLGDRADPDRDLVTLDGVPLPQRRERQYLMLHKPRAMSPRCPTSGDAPPWPSWWRTAGRGSTLWGGWIWTPRGFCC